MEENEWKVNKQGWKRRKWEGKGKKK